MSHDSFPSDVGQVLCDEVVPKRMRDHRWLAFGVAGTNSPHTLLAANLPSRASCPTSRSPQFLTLSDWRQVVSPHVECDFTYVLSISVPGAVRVDLQRLRCASIAPASSVG